MTIEIATTPEGVIDTPRKTLKQKMRGFTLIELGIVLTIVAILALFAIPRVQGYLISGRVQPTAAETADAVSQIRNLGAATGGAGQPYVGMTILNLATALRDRANVLIPTLAGANSTVQHRLGTAGANVGFAVGNIANAGDAFTLTFNTVNGAACADLATALQVQARKVVINANTTVVKDLDAATAVPYNAITAQSQCTTGDTNSLVFTFQ
jgi:type IV pilus assembly protein PilA